MQHAEEVMGTVVSFDVRTTGPEDPARAAITRAVGWLHWVDRTFSTYRPDSEIARLDRGEIAASQCAPEVGEILELCDELQSATGGYFDCRAGGGLDPSGVVKGWSLERASAILADAGYPDHTVNGGGDVRLRGQAAPGQPWSVGIIHPFRLDAFCATVTLFDGAVATSGTYERGFHVIDPHRHRPAMDLAAVTVIGPELTLTDAYATTALAMGNDAPAWLATLSDHEAFLIDATGRGWETPGFAAFRSSR